MNKPILLTRARGAQRAPWHRAAPALALAAAVAFSGCDRFLDVSSPSLVEDPELDSPLAMLSMLRGTMGDYTHAAAGEAGLGGVYMAGALLTDELVHSGTWRGHRSFSDGFSRDHWPEVDELWAAASQARWTSENLVPRMQRVMQQAGAGDADVEEQLGNQLATAMLWAGFSNRMMGDAFCQAVVDEGPLEPHTVFYERAEKHFTDAIAQALEMGRDTLRQAAFAGRAQARMMLGDWTGAVADAGEVETIHQYHHVHGGFTGRSREWNHFRVAVLFEFAEITMWGTPFADWARESGTTTGDPRLVYDIPNAVPVGRDGRRPFWRQNKNLLYGGDIAVTKGTEMRLIEAEAALLAGAWETAVDKINEVRAFRRTAAGGLPAADRTLTRLPNVTAEDADEAWVLLMRERGIDLYLEGRRLPDMRRWAVNPGHVPFEVVRGAAGATPEADERRNVLDVNDQLCIPVSLREKVTNPRIGG